MNESKSENKNRTILANSSSKTSSVKPVGLEIKEVEIKPRKKKRRQLAGW